MDDALTVCKQLAAVGIWIDLDPVAQTLTVGPTPVVQAHPALLAQVRAHEPAILAALQATLVAEIVARPDAGRFVLETCADCQQAVFVIAPPRRLAVHRTIDGRAVCPGAIRAQEATAHMLLQQFITGHCEHRPHAVLTWIALRGFLEDWARAEGWLLPPRPYVIAWLDAHYKRQSGDESYPSWQGLTFPVREWLGDDAEETVLTASTPTPARKKTLLRA